MNRKYFSLEKHEQNATINIYGDITSFPWFENDVSASNLSKQLETLTDVEQIDVYINSYGGEVAEGLAIYNALKRHKANVTTYCDGFAASIASVIFMAGNKRVMNESSLLMIHNAWTYAAGNAKELRKQADDLEKITQASVEAYKAHSSLSEDEIKELMDNETWILPEEAIDYGFATSVNKTENANASQHAFKQLFDIIKAYQEEKEPDEPDDENTEEKPVEDPDDTGEEKPDDEQEETTEEDTTEEETSEDETSDDEDEAETATQKMCGFFNALLK